MDLHFRTLGIDPESVKQVYGKLEENKSLTLLEGTLDYTIALAMLGDEAVIEASSDTDSSLGTYICELDAGRVAKLREALLLYLYERLFTLKVLEKVVAEESTVKPDVVKPGVVKPGVAKPHAPPSRGAPARTSCWPRRSRVRRRSAGSARRARRASRGVVDAIRR